MHTLLMAQPVSTLARCTIAVIGKPHIDRNARTTAKGVQLVRVGQKQSMPMAAGTGNDFLSFDRDFVWHQAFAIMAQRKIAPGIRGAIGTDRHSVAGAAADLPVRE